MTPIERINTVARACYRQHGHDSSSWLAICESCAERMIAAAVAEEREACAPVVAALCRFADWMEADCDDIADLFWRETGMMAPGKSEPMECCGVRSAEERRRAWDEWLKRRKEGLIADARAAIRARAGRGA